MARQNTLIGRDAERAALGRLLDGARDGESRTLLLRGEPGVGKTALLDDMIGSARDFRVLRAVGVDSEMELAFAALQQLCRALGEEVARARIGTRLGEPAGILAFLRAAIDVGACEEIGAIALHRRRPRSCVGGVEFYRGSGSTVAAH